MIDFGSSGINLILGTIVLLFGQQYFWLFLGIIAYAYGFNMTGYFYNDLSVNTLMGTGIVFSIPAMIMAVTIKPLASIITGISAGGLIAIHIYPEFLHVPQYIDWTIFAIGGMIGFIFSVIAFNWALIFFSSIIGAMFISYPFYDGSSTNNIAFGVLFFTGIYLQSFMYKNEKKQISDI